MGWLFFSVICLVAFAIAVGFAWKGAPERRGFGIAASVGIGVAYLLITLFVSATKVDPGQIGIVKSFGQIEGTIDPGLSMIAPWKSVDKVNTRVQKVKFAGDGKDADFPRISAGSSDNQSVYIDATVNWNLGSNEVVNLYKKVGANYFQVLVPPRINQVVKDITAQYPATEITKNREPIRKAIVERLQTELAAYSIDVTDVLLDNVSFTPEFQASVEAKVKAQQDAQRAVADAQKRQTEAQSEADALIKQRKAEADAKVTTANADAEATVTAATAAAQATRLAAEAEADANRKVAASITPALIQYQAAQNLANNAKILVLPGDAAGNYLFDPSKMFDTAGQ